ncbi:VWA domain-containing protein [Leptotrichia sp. OH3620_COT-345]|uniref:vWA domain-containing protein n=1 Tax=Leptotrichia sp. OH3620_COT-345 TaxID=2491048 RepID=UPI000F64ECCC|nr:vWA domain-containing protein [Leptotrichia sp. OH3620_COT-345]RRD38854.1 VWA domain-containing protein [Leptotrichia sp. OH3620_COT-345]
MKKILIIMFIILGILGFSKSVHKTGKKNDVTELVFILDRSGSMSGLETDTIGGYNSMVDKQKKETNGQIFVTTVLFDDKYELLHNRIAISEMKHITDKDYYVRGGTALLDAIGKTISQVKSNQNKLRNKEKAKKILFIIVTDGMENASKEYSAEVVKKLIETQKSKDKWEFLFLGANIDAIGTAGNFGIEPSRAVNYKSDSHGTKKNYEVLNEAIMEIRSGKELKDTWKKEIEDDYNKRK